MRMLLPLLLLACSQPDPDPEFKERPATGDPCTTCGTATGTGGGTPTGTPGGTPTGTGTATGGTTTGITFELDLPAANVVEPYSLAPLIGSFFDSPSLVEVLSSSPTLDLRAAATDGVMQERCQPTTDSTGNTFSAAPNFSASFDPFPTASVGLPMPMEGATLTGDYDAYAGTLSNVELEGTVDMLSLAPLIGSDPCTLLLSFGVNCEPCPAGGNTCLFLRFDQIPVINRTDALFLRTPTDVANDPTCP